MSSRGGRETQRRRTYAFIRTEIMSLRGSNTNPTGSSFIKGDTAVQNRNQCHNRNNKNSNSGAPNSNSNTVTPLPRARDHPSSSPAPCVDDRVFMFSWSMIARRVIYTLISVIALAITVLVLLEFSVPFKLDNDVVHSFTQGYAEQRAYHSSDPDPASYAYPSMEHSTSPMTEEEVDAMIPSIQALGKVSRYYMYVYLCESKLVRVGVYVFVYFFWEGLGERTYNDTSV